ncbi:hypothetical protein [Pseudoalteromonas sp. bablab_jr011]|uniref:hypothetical protein n=1 Tax=Pseudoalteromonas sp. bablab_jr011 TaxID=2755062 RepID=UPI0018F656E0|nr:hypothetical protein [Pseudoalteromonas sp. bablab_jr011]
MEPDYSNYSLQELLEARSSIDQQAHPLRYFIICQQIEVAANKPQERQALEKRDFFARFVLVKTIMALLSIILATKLYYAFSKGYISWKGNTDYFVQQNPQIYYVLVAVHVFFLGLFLVLLFTNRWIKKQNS